MSRLLTRTDAEPKLEIREFLIRSVDPENRTVSGIAVPWDTDTEIGAWYTERIAKGAVQDSDNAKLFWRHSEPIGIITEYRDTDAGWEITARISETPRGDEAYTLVRDGVIDRFSIGFEPIEHQEITDRKTGHLTVIRTKIRVREVSLVPFPAYKDAAVTKVREAQPRKESNMDEDEIQTDLTEIRTQVEDLDRRVQALPTAATLAEPATPFTAWRSIGEYVKAVASGDEDALRAYAGATTDDAITKAAWVGSLVEIIKKLRPTMETFATGPLPTTGMSFEYGVLKSDTTQVGIQAAQGDDLLFGKVQIDVRNGLVKTLGGWSSLARQVIERATVGVLDTTWEAMVEKYGRACEIYTRSLLNGALAWAGAPDSETPALAQVVADLTTQDGVVAMVLDLVEHFDNVGRSLDGIKLDRASFLSLYGVEANDRILQISGAPIDKVGTLTVKTASGEVANLKFELLPNAVPGTRVAYDKTAIRVRESGGAPTRLQDENIVNLSKDFSLYGYLGGAVEKPAGLVKIVDEA